jgi:hypothetical protein
VSRTENHRIFTLLQPNTHRQRHFGDIADKVSPPNHPAIEKDMLLRGRWKRRQNIAVIERQPAASRAGIQLS